MLIGKIWGEANNRWFWSTGETFEELRCALETDLMEYGENYEYYNPAKIELWEANKLKIEVRYSISLDDGEEPN